MLCHVMWCENFFDVNEYDSDIIIVLAIYGKYNCEKITEANNFQKCETYITRRLTSSLKSKT